MLEINIHHGWTYHLLKNWIGYKTSSQRPSLSLYLTQQSRVCCTRRSNSGHCRWKCNPYSVKIQRLCSRITIICHGVVIISITMIHVQCHNIMNPIYACSINKTGYSNAIFTVSLRISFAVHLYIKQITVSLLIHWILYKMALSAYIILQPWHSDNICGCTRFNLQIHS